MSTTSFSFIYVTDGHDSDDFARFEPFVQLPPRKDLPDYYEIIPNPVDIKSFRKRVKGVHGKQAATGVSEFKSWAAFEEAASYLWKNAFHYNEDGSDIFLLAKDLQVDLTCFLTTGSC